MTQNNKTVLTTVNDDQYILKYTVGLKCTHKIYKMYIVIIKLLKGYVCLLEIM